MQKGKWYRKILAGILVLSLSAGFSGCTFAGRQVYISSGAGLFNVFRIGDFVCTQSEAKLYLLNYKNIYGVISDTDILSGNENAEKLWSSLKKSALAQLSRVYAMNQYAKNKGTSLNSQEQSAVHKAAKKYYASLTAAERKYLDADQNDIEEMYSRLALAEKVYTRLMSKVDDEVSDDEARVMDAEVIQVSDKSKAETVQSLLNSGSAFEVLSNYNEGKHFERNIKRGDESTEIEDAAFALEDGQVSSMISSGGSYYFIKCISKYDEKLSNENKEKIIGKRQEKALQNIISDLDREEYSELNQRVWNSIPLPENKNLTSGAFFDDLKAYLSYS